MEELIIKVNGREYKVAVEEAEGGKIKVYCGNDVYDIEAKSESEIKHAVEAAEKSHHFHEGETPVAAPLPGIVAEVCVKKGEKIKTGQILFRIIAMKMENEITAARDGEIKEVNVKKNANVSRGDILAVIG